MISFLIIYSDWGPWQALPRTLLGSDMALGSLLELNCGMWGSVSSNGLLRIITWVFYCWRYRVVIMEGLLPYRRLNSWYYGLARRIAWYWVFFSVSPVLMALESCFLSIQNLLENEHGYRSANYRRAHILIFVFWGLESSAWSELTYLRLSH